MEFFAIIMYSKGSKRLMEIKQNPYLNRKERLGKRSLNKTHIEMKGGSNNILCMFSGYV